MHREARRRKQHNQQGDDRREAMAVELEAALAVAATLLGAAMLFMPSRFLYFGGEASRWAQGKKARARNPSSDIGSISTTRLWLLRIAGLILLILGTALSL